MLKYLIPKEMSDEQEYYKDKCSKLEKENKKLKLLIDSLQLQIGRARADARRFDTSIYL